MKVQLLTTLKGSEIRRKGTVFDDTVSPIPHDILTEVARKRGTVKVLQGATEKPKAVAPVAEPEDIAKLVVNDLDQAFNIPELDEFGVNDLDQQPENLTETKDSEAVPPVLKELGDTEKVIPIDPDVEFILSKMSANQFSKRIGASYQTVLNWKKGSTPTAKYVQRIKKLARELRDDRIGTDSPSASGTEGFSSSV